MVRIEDLPVLEQALQDSDTPELREAKYLWFGKLSIRERLEWWGRAYAEALRQNPNLLEELPCPEPSDKVQVLRLPKV